MRTNTPLRMANWLAIALVVMAALFVAPAQAQVTGPFINSAVGLTNTAHAVKAARGMLQWINCYNPNADVEYLQFFDLAAGSVTVGVTVPKAAIAVGLSGSSNYVIPAQFLSAITVAATTTPAGGTAPGAALNCTFGFN